MAWIHRETFRSTDPVRQWVQVSEGHFQWVVRRGSDLRNPLRVGQHDRPTVSWCGSGRQYMKNATKDRGGLHDDLPSSSRTPRHQAD